MYFIFISSCVNQYLLLLLQTNKHVVSQLSLPLELLLPGRQHRRLPREVLVLGTQNLFILRLVLL